MADAAVGSISHILKTAFKDVYEDKRDRDEYTAARASKAQADADADTSDPTNEDLAMDNTPDGHGTANREAVDEPSTSSPSTIPAKVPKTRAVDTLELGEHHKRKLLERNEEISRALEEKNIKADHLVQHLQQQRAHAKQKRIEEEETLKKQGIIIGQHIPPLPSKLDINPSHLQQYGEFSSNLLIARDLVSQNHVNMLRRTGNLPISDQLEQRKLDRGKRQQDMESDAPHYLEQTHSQEIRQSVTHVKFNESLTRHAQELTMKEPVVMKKRKKVLSAAERFENEAILKNINHKLNYLRNPRNDPGTVANMLTKTKQTKAVGVGSDGDSAYSAASHNQEAGSVSAESQYQPKQPTKGGKGPSKAAGSVHSQASVIPAPLFVAEPKRVLFNGFDIGNEYKKTVTFRNVSTASRTFRVLPPRTPQFAMSPLQYPQNSRGGLVAPGMNVTAVLTFFPDSLGEFDDYIVVETEGGVISVPILARRESPILTLPPVLSIGSCLVGDALRTSIRCFNAGGPGKFQVVSFDEFEQGLSVSNSVDCLRIQPFTIYPLEFAIDRNCFTDFSIEYVPNELGESRGDFVVLSDSGQSFKYTIVASSLGTNVYICEINGTAVEPEDETINRNLYFNASFVGSQQSQQIHLANDTGLPVEFEWVWIDSKAKDTKRASIDKLIRREKGDNNAIHDGDSSVGIRSPRVHPHHAIELAAGGMKSSIGSKTRALNFEASLPLPAPPGAVVVASDDHSAHRKGANKNKKSIMGTVAEEVHTGMEKHPFDNTLDFAANTASFKGGFEIEPARGLLGVDGVVDFNVHFSPTSTDEKSARLVLLLRHVTKSSPPGPSQDDALRELALYGHGPHHRLRSWVSEMAEVSPLYPNWVEGSAAAVGAQPHALTPQVVKMVNLKTVLSLAMNFCPDCTTEDGELTPLSSMLYYRFREVLKFVQAYQNNEFSADVDEDMTSLDGMKREELLRSLSLTLDVVTWTTDAAGDNASVSSSDQPKLVPPVIIKPRGFSMNIDGEAVIDDTTIEKEFTAKEKSQLVNVWLNVENAVMLLGDEICDVLDLIIKHEATDYIQSMARRDLPCLSLQAFGSGKPCTVTVDPPKLIIGGNLTIGKRWKGTVTLRNASNVIADITLDPSKLSITAVGHSDSYGDRNAGPTADAVTCELSPSHLLLMPESEVTVDIDLSVNCVGDFEIQIPAEPTHDLIYVDNIVIAVRTTGPRLRFDEPDIDIGLMSTGLEGRKTFSFVNESDVPLRYALTGSVDSKSVASAMTPKDGSPTKTPSKGGRRSSSRRSSRSNGNSPKTSSGSASHDVDDQSQMGMLSSRSETSVMSRDSFTVENPTAHVWYEPTSGLVQPGEHVSVTMVCMGGKLAQRLRGNIECIITDVSGAIPLPMQLLPFRGEIQMPKAIISPVYLDVGTVFENIRVPIEVTLQNLSNLPSKYKFERPGGNNPLYILDFENDIRSGTLGPKEVLKLKMSFVALKQGVISDAIACKIFGVPQPIGFGITAVVKALSLEFSPLPDGTPAPNPLCLPTACQYTGSGVLPEPAPVAALDIGAKVKLYERKTTRFMIRNLSAIPANYSIAPRLYGLGETPELEGAPMGFSKTVKRTEMTLLVPREDGENKFHSEMGKEHVGAIVKKQEDKAYLTLGKGASYAIEPSSGTLPPWGVQVVNVYARNDMPGCFDDEIVCDVLNYRKISIPLNMTVEGCPLVVQRDTYGMTSRLDPESKVEKPLLLLGNLCKDEDAPERQFRIRNNGSVPTKISWKVRSVTSKVNGPVKVELKLGQSLKVKTKFIFWDDLAKETPFLVEPTSALIPAYGAETFRVKLLRTSNVCSERGLLTGSVILNNESNSGGGNENSAPTLQKGLSQVGLSRGSSQHMLRRNSSMGTSSMSSQYKLEVQLQGNVMNPEIRLDEHVVPVKFPESVAPSAATISMRTHVPLLFENGAKNFDVCVKDIIIQNPLTANLAFTVSVEGPFLLRSKATGSSPNNQSDNNTVSTRNSVSTQSPKASTSASTMGKAFHLLPEATATVSVVLAPKRDLREALKEGSGPSTKSVKQREEKGNLVLSFWTGQKLRVPINVVLATPLITVSSPKVNFGVCHATKSCDGTVLLSNPTDVIARWSVVHVPASDPSFGGKTMRKTSTIRVSGFEERAAPVDDPEVFSIGPNAGMVEGPSISVTAAMQCPSKDFTRGARPVVEQRLVENSWAAKTLTMRDTLSDRNRSAHQSDADPLYPMPVQIKFAPRKNVRYCSRFRFVCEYGNTFDVLLEGEGTYEEHLHQPIYPMPRI